MGWGESERGCRRGAKKTGARGGGRQKAKPSPVAVQNLCSSRAEIEKSKVIHGTHNYMAHTTTSMVFPFIARTPLWLSTPYLLSADRLSVLPPCPCLTAYLLLASSPTACTLPMMYSKPFVLHKPLLLPFSSPPLNSRLPQRTPISSPWAGRPNPAKRPENPAGCHVSPTTADP